MKKLDRFIKKVIVPLDVLHFPPTIENPRGPNCPNCAAPLSLLQPDLELPERLIGICEKCKYWFLIDIAPGQSEWTMVRLPETQVIKSLSQGKSQKGSR